VNFALDHGSSIHDVSGNGNERAASTVSHPSGSAMERSLPLRASWRRTSRASQAVAGSPESTARRHTYLMPAPSFREWLRNRAQEPLAAGILPMLVARSAAGMSRDDLAKALRLPPETLDDLLRAVAATGQVTMLKAGGRTVYKATG
jgi:hypothetical protein